MTREWTIGFRGPDLRKLGETDRFRKLDLALRDTFVDNAVITIPADLDIAQFAVAGNGYIVEADGDVVSSGPIIAFDYAEKKGVPQDLVLGGVSDDIILEDRLALTDPLAAGGNPLYDVISGTASTVMTAFVNRNLGNVAQTQRRVASFSTDNDPLLGGTVIGRGKFQAVGELLRELAVLGGDLSFGVTYNKTSASLLFKIYQGRDLRATARFSADDGTVEELKYGLKAPEANFIIAGGTGTDTSRIYDSNGDSASIAKWGRRIEGFLNAQDSQTTAEIRQNINAELVTAGETTSYNFEALDIASLTFLKDYRLGDIGSSIVFDTSISGKIREVSVVVEKGGETIKPTLGTPAATSLVPVFIDTLAKIRREVASLGKR